MKRHAVRKPTNLSLDSDLVAEARTLRVNVSRAAEAGIDKAVRQARGEAWLKENAEAIRSHNEWVEKNGLPLARWQVFQAE